MKFTSKNLTRRHAIKLGSISAIFASLSGFARSVFAEWPAESFATAVYDEAYAFVTEGSELKEGGITIEAPEIASNGATVPINISTDLQGVNSISILVEKNPRPYISTFFMNEHIES